MTIWIASATEIIAALNISVKKTERPVWTGLSRLAEAFSLDWLPSSPRQPHSPLSRILVKMFLSSIGQSGYL
jgi:hypothetical protein